MARFAHVDETRPTTQTRRVGVAALVALLLAVALVVTLGSGRSGPGTDVAGKSWSRVAPPTPAPTTTVTATPKPTTTSSGTASSPSTPTSTTATTVTKAVPTVTSDGKSWAA